MNANTNTDPGTGAVVMAYTVPPATRRKALDIHRENDGTRQLVGYPGWKTIIERLATRRP